MKKLTEVLLLCVFLLALATPAGAQTGITGGSIQGTVVDASGGVVPGAGVEVKSLETGAIRNLTTDGDGRFAALQLASGRYTLTITKSGFATVIQENVTLTVGQNISLSLTMKVAAAAETITVTATPTVDVIKTESSTTLNQNTVSTTPVLGRKFEDLLTLTPGVSIVQGPDGDVINFNGQRGVFNNISLDGGDYNNGFFGEQLGGQRASIDITLDAIKEFQVIAAGATAEFGRTAGGVVNVITKSGTNEWNGSNFAFFRNESLSANTSDGKPLKDFHHEQFGATIGGPVVKDKHFLFAAFEQITANLQRDNLSVPIGTPCSVSAPTIQANETLINGSPDCQRLALINFIRNTRGTDEGRPVRHPVHNSAFLGKWDWHVTSNNHFAFSYNFDRSNKPNETFDVPTFGTSANGNEGPSRIQVLNFNHYTTFSAAVLNEAHVTYQRENRPRAAVRSNVPADTGVGFVPTFRFGDPFFLQPTIDEVFSRTQIRDNVSIVWNKHTIKFGGEWVHSLNDQIFRGFFTGNYRFASVTGFLRYASPTALGPGFGPLAAECANATFTTVRFVTLPAACPAGTSLTGGPLLFYLQSADRAGLATDATGASKISNEDLGFFVQDKWQITPRFTLNFGLRWEVQTFPGPVVPPSQTAYGPFLSNPLFPSDGTLHDQKNMWQPRVGWAWDMSKNGKSVLRSSFGIYNGRQNMLTQVGSITTNGVQQQTIFRSTGLSGFLLSIGVPPAAAAPTWPGVITPLTLPSGTFPDFTGVRVFSRNYANPRIYTTNFAFEQELWSDWAGYLDFTWSKGVHLTRFYDANNGFTPVALPRDGNAVTYTGPSPFGPQLGFVFVAESSAKSLYRGLTIGMRKRFSHKYQLEWNYVLSWDHDDDSNERDPFSEGPFNRFNFTRDYAFSDRDIRHKFNFYTYAELPWGFEANVRMQARSAQPITINEAGNGSGAPCSETNSRTRVVNGIDCGRNHLRKNNEYFSLDWRLLRPIKFGERFALTPMMEMFNTFNNDNNYVTVRTAALFNFDGFLRQGVGDPLQVQFAVKFTW